MKITIWVREGTWPACVDAARELAGSRPAEVTLICVREASAGAPDTGFGSLIGRGRRRQATEQLDQLGREAAETMLRQARERLGQDAEVRLESGFPERIVTAAAGDADYLILGRDGDHTRLGPGSLGKHTRFVVDHAPCRVLLIWPGNAPAVGSIPPPPPDR
ncbi:MAG: universal stress protein [Micropruina sp.]|uniref:universal stress protein n=1 Tax=Micropruina sp. TaxID=2737536 RepID=UPI0039E2347D